MNKIRMVLFDLNGTIFDDTQIWFDSVESVFNNFGLEPPSIADFFRSLEKDYISVYQKYGITATREEINQIYCKTYIQLLDRTKLNPNILETITKIPHWVKLGIVTSQPENLVAPLLEKFELLPHFSLVMPHILDKSACINQILSRHRLNPASCIYVGDAPSDIKHAKKSGVKSAAFLNPFIPIDLIGNLKPDHIISDMSEILSIIEDC